MEMVALTLHSSAAAGSSHAERLWKQYFTDPSQWWDNRNSKIHPTSPDFKHKLSKASLWIDGWYNPSWVKHTFEKTETPKAQALRQRCPWGMPDLEEALASLERMPHPPSAENLTCILRKCRKGKNPAHARRLHAYMRKSGLEVNRFLGNYLLSILVEVGNIYDAQQVFDRLVERDEYSWTYLIKGYIECGELQHAFTLYQKMQEDSVHPSGYTFGALLRACARLKDTERGREIHAEIAKNGLLECNLFVGNALVDMYSKCGSLAEAREVFDTLPVRDAVSWTSLIAGYAEHKVGQEALNCSEQMQLEGILRNAVTFVCSLKACGRIGAINKGREIHAEIARMGLVETEPFVGSTLVDMYAKCGSLAEAREVFEKLPVRDAVSWTALIAGYAQLGESENTFLMLDSMIAEDIKPDGVTFRSILTVCSHAGLVDKGQTYFDAMTKDYGITPTIEHYICMVDLLCRAGQLDKAVVMIKNMPFNPGLVLWHTVLGACWKWANVELGRWAFDHAMQLDKKDAAAYVLMSNIYADAHMEEDAKQVEVMRLKEQAWKKPGRSWWTDVGRIMHSFLAGDTGYSQSNDIYGKLEALSLKIREDQCVSDLYWPSQDMSDDLKEDGLCGHGEKLAIF